MASWGLLQRSLRHTSGRCFSMNFARPFITMGFSQSVNLALKPETKAGVSDHIGISFGTTNTRVAVIEGESAKVIVNSPSVVAYVREGDYFVGEEARLWAVDDPENTICGIQRLLGRKFDDPMIRKEMEMVPYRIVRAPNGDAWVEAYGRQYSPTEIAAKLLANLKKTAEEYLFKSVSNAIITFPRDVSDAQYNAILDAASMAGLDLLIAINEPVVAAISYGLIRKNGLIAVLNLGGRNFDVSLLGISNGDFQCVGKDDPFLGGKDFDDVIVEYLVTEIKRVEGIDISMDKLALQRLRLLAEDTKIALSSYLKVEINWYSILADASGTRRPSIILTRSKFESLIKALIERMRSLCASCLNETGITAEYVNEVLLVGGMTKVPKVQEVVAEIFRKIPCKKVNPDDAVVVGAVSAIQAGFFRGNVWENFPNNVAVPRGEMEFSFRNGNRIADSTSIVKFPFSE